jgi:hypothetical protein
LRDVTWRTSETPCASGSTRKTASPFEGARQHDLAARERREPALLLRVAAEAGDGEPAVDEGRERRQRGHRAPHLLEQQAELQEAHLHAAQRLGDGQAEQVRLGELRPELAVEPVALGLQFLQALDVQLLLEDLAGELAEHRLLFAEVEVHRVAASPTSPGRRRGD